MNVSVAAPDRSVSASCPVTVPRIQPEIVTTPPASAATDGGVVPAVAVRSTARPANGLSNASVMRAEIVAAGSPARPLTAIGVMGTKCAAGPGTPVAVITSGVTPDTDTVIVFAPARGPSVHTPTDVGEADVRPGVPATLPPPDTFTENLTSAIGAPAASKTTNCGAAASVVPAAAVCPSPATRRISAGLTLGPVES